MEQFKAKISCRGILMICSKVIYIKLNFEASRKSFVGSYKTGVLVITTLYCNAVYSVNMQKKNFNYFKIHKEYLIRREFLISLRCLCLCSIFKTLVKTSPDVL